MEQFSTFDLSQRQKLAPELTPGGIARALHISSRYLRMLFRQEQETVSAYILRRRLDECARLLSDPAWDRNTISEIAFSRGFNNLMYFGQAFKRRYGVTPGQYRRRKPATFPSHRRIFPL